MTNKLFKHTKIISSRWYLCGYKR